MPKGPKGEKRPADVIGNAVHVMRIAIGEIEESPLRSAKAKAGKLGGHKGGKARAANMPPSKRKASAKKAARARWDKNR